MRLPKSSWVKKFTNSNGFIRSVIQFVIFVAMLIPFDIGLIVYLLLRPSGFWERFAIIAGWIVVLGWLQLIACIIAAAASFKLWFENL